MSGPKEPVVKVWIFFVPLGFPTGGGKGLARMPFPVMDPAGVVCRWNPSPPWLSAARSHSGIVSGNSGGPAGKRPV